ncbi:MAG: hypothetical protein J6Y02_00980 [Pseudobutyrivibrio sp.]|nr:hypothetical protein [Pseudobutyrivibrio sp.]
MPKGKVTSLKQNKSGGQPALLSQEARMSQLTSLALDLVEQRLRDGTATSQETTYFLKYNNREAELKEQILEKQKELMEAKAESLRSQKRTEELYTNAIAAMRRYSGISDDEDIYGSA